MSKNDRIDEGSEISEKTEEAKPKRKGGKAAIVVGVVAAIVIVAGVGFTIWHEQPSFCNAICHDPMDPYVEGYYEENSPILSAVHQANQVTCLDAHVIGASVRRHSLDNRRLLHPAGDERPCHQRVLPKRSLPFPR